MWASPTLSTASSFGLFSEVEFAGQSLDSDLLEMLSPGASGSSNAVASGSGATAVAITADEDQAMEDAMAAFSTLEDLLQTVDVTVASVTKPEEVAPTVPDEANVQV